MTAMGDSPAPREGHEYLLLNAEMKRLWDEVTEIRKELKSKDAVEQDLKERLMSLELRFGVLQGEIIKRLEEYRDDHKSYLELYKEQLQSQREVTSEADAKKWKLIWLLVLLVAAAAGWDMTGLSIPVE